jgi:hypothetical protein
MTLARFLVAVALLAGLALAGCGGGGEVTGPSEVVPAKAPIYFEVSIRPEGEARAGAEAAAATLLDTDDPGARLISLLEEAAAKDGVPFEYEHDIASWLGERVGFFPPDLEDESDVTIVIETTDADAALAFARLAGTTAEGEREREYHGQSFQIDDDGDAFGLVGDFLLVGDRGGFKQAVDTAEDENSLANSGEFQDAVENLPDDSLATLYADPETFIEAVPGDEAAKSLVKQALGDAATEPVLGSLVASGSGIEVELSAGGGGVESAQSSLLEQLPASAWLAVGFSDIGGTVEKTIAGLEDAGIFGLSAETIATQVRSATGIDLEREVIGALGDAGLFVSGTTTRSLGGGAVIESKDPDASAALLVKLQRLIRRQGEGVRVRPLASTDGAPGFELIDPSGDLAHPIRVFQRDDRIVAAYGARAGAQLLGAGQTLASDPTYLRAKEQIGDLGVDLYVSVAQILRLAESEGAASDPDYRTAKPYLDGLDYLVVGSGSEGDRSVLDILLGIR